MLGRKVNLFIQIKIVYDFRNLRAWIYIKIDE